MHIVDFLDGAFDLLIRTYKTPNDWFMYVNTPSSHPSQIAIQLPTFICNRIKNNYSNKPVFDLSALRESEKKKKSLDYTNKNDIKKWL